MASSLQGKTDSQTQRVSEQEAAAVPERARASDESPTVISKTPPIVPPASDLSRRSSADAIVAGLNGRKLAHYELLDAIGVGGMAAVIRARDTQLDRLVALKILPPEMAKEPDNVSRFHQEARAAAKLDHENIARVFYCGEDQGLHFIAFEYVEGTNLRTMLEQRGRLPVAETVRYILQVATGLEHAATRGVVHRDVKPSNIIITPTGRAKLVDMGLARNLERRGEADLTQSGMTLGTFDYISPEQALEPRDADMRSDIYSLGCTFYHLLTGLSPVPEGTPAKKLHHHQNMSPVDPRSIDASIPDEIVMILDKMMRKNPTDRYQRPIHLVHHLMQVAQKVGAADDLPEGVMFVDTPLPGHERGRPLLLIGMALLALVAVTALLSFAPQPAQNNGKGKGQVALKGPDVTDKGTKGNGNPPPPVVPYDKRPDTVSSRDDLRAVFADQDTQAVTAKIDGEIELDGVKFKGNHNRRLTLKSSDDLDANLLKLQYTSSTPIGMIVEGGEEVVFRKLKFQVDAATTPGQAVACVALRGVKRAKFEQCIFAQPNLQKITAPSAGKRVPIASVLIENLDGDDTPTNVEFTDCYFDSGSINGGQVAIAVNGPANVTVTDTAFRPHNALFSFRDKCTRDTTRLTLQHCTSFVVTGPAFRFAENASAQVRASDSAFTRPERRLSDAGLAQAGLIYLSGPKAITYEGRRNLYHALNDFVEKKSGAFIARMDDFAAQPGITDVDAKYFDLAESAENPLAHPKDTLAETGVRAFQLKPEFASFGLQKTWLNDKMPVADGALVKIAPPQNPKKKVVDPVDSRRKEKEGEFASVAEALARAKSGDTIYIKHGDDSPQVVVTPFPLKRSLSVTLAAYEGFQPVLVLDKDSSEKDSALFKMQDGTLAFENLEFLLDPVRQGFESQSIIHLGEAANCSFKQCIVSLRTQNNIQLNVVTFVDLDRMMKMDTPPGASARVEFLDCFVRGKGDLVALRGCRPLQVELKNSLVALDGSLLDVIATDKMMPMSAPGVRWKMERTSVITTDSIFALRSKTGLGLTKTQASADGCLFVSLKPETPMVLLDMTKSADLADYLDWNGWKGDPNFYANHDNQRVREWKDLFTETKADFAKLGLLSLGEKVQKLWESEPGWFKPSDADELKRIQNFGIPAETEKAVGSSRVDLQACKLEYSIVSPK